MLRYYPIGLSEHPSPLPPPPISNEVFRHSGFYSTENTLFSTLMFYLGQKERSLELGRFQDPLIYPYCNYNPSAKFI